MAERQQQWRYVIFQKIKYYDIEITKIDEYAKIKNISFKITDKELLDKTGGVVQGMSGSPIMQNGKIIGAVTHVIIDNPTIGYGLFITTMLDEGEKQSSIYFSFVLLYYW